MGRSSIVAPGRSIDAHHIAPERSIGGIQAKYIILAPAHLQAQGQHHFYDFLWHRTRLPLPGEPDHLHTKGTSPTHNPSLPEVPEQCFAQGNWIDPRVKVEVFILVMADAFLQFVGNTVTFRKSPLSIGGDPGRK